MAFPYDMINSFAQEHYRPTISDTIFKGNVLTKKLFESNRIQVDGGTEIRQVLEFAMANGSNYDGAYDLINAAPKKTHDYAVLDWKFKIVESTISDKDIIMNSGKEKIFDLVKTKIGGMKKKMMDMVGTGVYYDTTGTTEMDGLRLAIDTANTYAGIDQSTYTWWAAGKEDASTATLTLGSLETNWNTIVDASNGEQPNLVVTTATIFTSMQNLVQPQQRFQGDQANVGFPSMIYKGVPFVLDTKCTSQHLFMLNTDHIKLWVADKMNFDFTGWVTPTNQPSAKVAFLKLGVNLLVDNPRTCGKMTALTA